MPRYSLFLASAKYARTLCPDWSTSWSSWQSKYAAASAILHKNWDWRQYRLRLWRWRRKWACSLNQEQVLPGGGRDCKRALGCFQCAWFKWWSDLLKWRDWGFRECTLLTLSQFNLLRNNDGAKADSSRVIQWGLTTESRKKSKEGACKERNGSEDFSWSWDRMLWFTAAKISYWANNVAFLWASLYWYRVPYYEKEKKIGRCWV